MKKIISLTLIAAMILSATFACFGVEIKIDNKYVQFTGDSGAPFIDSANRTQVPLRVTMEAYGCHVDWDGDTRTAIVEKDGTVVKVPIGQSYILVNGVKKTNDTVAVIKDSRTYLPIRAVLEAFGANVGWDQNTQTVEVSSNNTDTDFEYNAAENLTAYIIENGRYNSSSSFYSLGFREDDSNIYINYYPNKNSLEIEAYTDYYSENAMVVSRVILNSSVYPFNETDTYYECYAEYYGSGTKLFSVQGNLNKNIFEADETAHFRNINTSDETVKLITSTNIGIGLMYLEQYRLMHDIDCSASDLGYRNLY